MGFLDRAKSTIKKATKGIGEETVNVVDYDEVYEEQERAKRQNSPRKKPVKNVKEANYSNGLEPEEDFDDDYGITSHEDIPVVEETAFDIDLSETKDFITEKREKNKPSERHPDKKEQDEKVKDVLELLNIPITFEIESDVFLPEDLKEVSFDVQVPQGYEIGEVNTFVSRTKISISRLVDLLKQRNEHIAKLATMVDRLQVDVNNMKFQNEVANGINVMPTSNTENEDVANENFELKLALKRLQEELDSVSNSNESNAQSSDLSNSQKEQFRNLQDELSLGQREIEDLKEEILELKNQNAVLIENQDFVEDSQIQEEMSDFAYDLSDPDFIEDDKENDEEVEDSLEFPDEDLTNLSSFGKEPHIPDPGQGSAFYDEDIESTDEFLKKHAEYYEIDPSENPEDNLGIFDNFENEGSKNNDRQNISYFEENDDDDDILNSLQEWDNK